MTKTSLGPAISIPGATIEPIDHIGPPPQNGHAPVAQPFPFDLGALQRRIMAQLQQCEGQMVALDRERQQLANAIVGLRANLDLIAELARQHSPVEAMPAMDLS